MTAIHHVQYFIARLSTSPEPLLNLNSLFPNVVAHRFQEADAPMSRKVDSTMWAKAPDLQEFSVHAGPRRFRNVGQDGHKQEAAVLRSQLVQAERSRARAASELAAEKKKTGQQNSMIAQLNGSIHALQEQVQAKERALHQALYEVQQLHQQREVMRFQLATLGRPK